MKGLARRIERARDRIIGEGALNTVTVKLLWDDASAEDVNDEETYTEAEAPLEEEVAGLVHFVTMGDIRSRGYIELRVGDAIVDFPPDVELDGKNNLRFEIDGRAYTYAGKEIERWFDTIVEGRRMFRTVALKMVPRPPPPE